MAEDQANYRSPMVTNEVDRSRYSRRHKLLLLCVVCNGNAHGYNFDAISCESCKAFFRRNALRIPVKFKCRGDGHCNVTGDQRRSCKKCRLDKCFQAGMRKEWILTEKEKQEKRLKIERNRHLRRLQDEKLAQQQSELRWNNDLPIYLHSSSLMNSDDWSTMEWIESIYKTAIDLNPITSIAQYPSIQAIETRLDFFAIPLNISSMRMIAFFKQVKEFQELDKHEQLYLVKLNTLTIVFLHFLLIYNDEKKTYHEMNTMDPIFVENQWLNLFSDELQQQMKSIQTDFIQLIHSDPIILKIFFLIVLFSNVLNPQNIPMDHHSLKTFHLQNIYNDFLFKYCLHRYGLINASKIYLRYVSKLMQLERFVGDFRSFLDRSSNKNELPALMQSLI